MKTLPIVQQPFVISLWPRLVVVAGRSLQLILTGLLFLALQVNVYAQQPTNKSSRPNIVFIMSDDHAYQAISAYSNRLIETPNIDRIAKMGMLFTQASVTNSICAPSRATILTGKHSHRNGKIDNHFPFDTTNVTFPVLLQRAGYQTAMFGKLHFGNSPKASTNSKYCLIRVRTTIPISSPKTRATSKWRDMSRILSRT